MLCSRASIDSFKRSAPLLVFQSVHRAREVRITMFSNYNHFVQKGYGNFEDDDDDIESSQESQSEHSSQSSISNEEMESSQEEEEHIDPWSRIQNEASDRHEAQLEAV